jgi:hypothetical protein
MGKELQNIYDDLNIVVNKKVMEEIMLMKTPDEMIGKYHFGLGTYIRNKWFYGGNGNDKDRYLLKYYFKCDYFNFHTDTISSFILESYWCYLHNKEFDISMEYKKHHCSYESTNFPNIKEIEDEIVEKINTKIYYEFNSIYYVVHVYKINNSSDYYIYDMIRGWKRIVDGEYKFLNKSIQKYRVVEKITYYNSDDW